MQVVLSDICPKALSLAQENAKKNGVEVRFYQGDLLAPFEGQKADFIVSNPPYLAKQEFENLDPDVKNYEPYLALVGGETGLEFYERFLTLLPRYVKKNAKIFFEIGHEQKNSLEALAVFQKRQKTNSFSFHFAKDWSGKDRFFFLEFE
jgi:release factor glutamine methyltransferase